MKLFMKDFEVTLVNNSMKEFYVNFAGPKDSLYEGGLWKIHVQLPDEYPYKSPSIGFKNTIYHPNIDERSGSVCLDVINQTWSPMFDMVNIFEQFLPQLLRYPNAADPLNPDASNLYHKSKRQYEETVRDYVKSYADPDQVRTMIILPEDSESKISKPEVATDVASDVSMDTRKINSEKTQGDAILTETDDNVDDEVLSADEHLEDDMEEIDNAIDENYDDAEEENLEMSVDEEIGETMDL
ncbi:hypothetical protein BRETT_004831 [Brettanomyces bruxellensis]|uniref:Ubiquitin-conjugating enzyme E2 H n=1 Tax=Dekkera bruxellensis TaxID=5007 RepID=A0A871R2Z0_DEKBR|nr:uncharacterized protein BRETT_004831 [Brettanomyces bruxellensis]QOU20179.1 hypothetical protein BRETT_004831 [Brettanomyces bruxellensis]